MTLRTLSSFFFSQAILCFSGYLSFSFTAYQSVLFSLVNTNFQLVYQGKQSSSLTSRVRLVSWEISAYIYINTHRDTHTQTYMHRENVEKKSSNPNF